MSKGKYVVPLFANPKLMYVLSRKPQEAYGLDIKSRETSWALTDSFIPSWNRLVAILLLGPNSSLVWSYWDQWSFIWDKLDNYDLMLFHGEFGTFEKQVVSIIFLNKNAKLFVFLVFLSFSLLLPPSPPLV